MNFSMFFIGVLVVLLSAQFSVAQPNSYTFTQRQQLLQGTPGVNNFFGWSMVLDKSATYMAVGAPLAAAGGSFRGEVNVFQRNPTGTIGSSPWAWQASGSSNVLRNTIDVLNFDFFGQQLFVGFDTVATSPTFNNVLVAVYALRGDVSRLREGGVYLFNRVHSNTSTANPWTTNAGFALVNAAIGVNGKIRPVAPLNPFRFGEALAGDLARNNSKNPLLVIGEFRFQQKQGRVNLLQYTGGNWVNVTSIVASGLYQQNNAGFGISLSLNNNMLAVGSSGAQLNRGVVHLYNDVSVTSTPSFSYLITVQALDGVVGDQYGWSIALNNEWLIVGANRRQDCGVSCGAVYAHFKDTGTQPTTTIPDNWGQKVKLSVPIGKVSKGAQLGFSVSISGGYVVAGAPDLSTNTTSSSGALFVFQQNTGNDGYYKADGWGFAGTFQKNTPVSRDRFGRNVATFAPHIIGAAMLDDTSASNAGSVYYFTGNLPLGGITGNPVVNPNNTASTTTGTPTTTASGTASIVSAGAASELGCWFA